MKYNESKLDPYCAQCTKKCKQDLVEGAEVLSCGNYEDKEDDPEGS